MLEGNAEYRWIHKSSCGQVLNPPVGCQGGEREYWHANRRELDEGDQFASCSAEEPLVGQVTAGVYGRARNKQQHVTERKAAQEQVGNVAHGFNGAERADERQVTHKTHQYDQRVYGSDHDSRVPRRGIARVRRAPVLPRLIG